MDGLSQGTEIVQTLLSQLAGQIGTNQLPFNTRAHINEWARANNLVLDEPVIQGVFRSFQGEVERRYRECMIVFKEDWEVTIIDY